MKKKDTATPWHNTSTITCYVCTRPEHVPVWQYRIPSQPLWSLHLWKQQHLRTLPGHWSRCSGSEQCSVMPLLVTKWETIFKHKMGTFGWRNCRFSANVFMSWGSMNFDFSSLWPSLITVWPRWCWPMMWKRLRTKTPRHIHSCRHSAQAWPPRWGWRSSQGRLKIWVKVKGDWCQRGDHVTCAAALAHDYWEDTERWWFPRECLKKNVLVPEMKESHGLFWMKDVWCLPWLLAWFSILQ